jgi:plasmid stabilization system protein ParE
MIVVLTAEAEADLEQIADDIAADNPMRALSFVGELRELCERLAEIPTSMLQRGGAISCVDSHGLHR